MAQLEVTKFATGAVRDKKEIPVRWDLFSVVALQAIAASEVPPINLHRPWVNYVGDAANHLLIYVGGKRDRPHLELAFWSLSHACDLVELSNDELRERIGLRQSNPLERGSLAQLSHCALQHLASTCAEGCGKYGEWNWLYGFPLTSVISHALDHIWSITNANKSEDHWGHALWNVATAIHNTQMRPDLCTGMLGDWFQLTDEIKQTLDKQREERARHELGRDPVSTGVDGVIGRRSGDDIVPGDRPAVAVPDGVIERIDPGDEWEGCTDLGRAIEEARGGPAPVLRDGYA